MPFFKPRAVCAALHRHYAVEHFCKVLIVPALGYGIHSGLSRGNPVSLRRVYKCGVLLCAVPCSRKFILVWLWTQLVDCIRFFRRLSEIGYKRVVCSSRGQQCVAHETERHKAVDALRCLCSVSCDILSSSS